MDNVQMNIVKDAVVERRGHDLPTCQGNDAWMVLMPATFMVGTDGLVRARFIDPDYRRGVEVDDLLAAFRPSA
jgi:hypothetical protein